MSNLRLVGLWLCWTGSKATIVKQQMASRHLRVQHDFHFATETCPTLEKGKKDYNYITTLDDIASAWIGPQSVPVITKTCHGPRTIITF